MAKKPNPNPYGATSASGGNRSMSERMPSPPKRMPSPPKRMPSPPPGGPGPERRTAAQLAAAAAKEMAMGQQKRQQPRTIPKPKK